MNTYSRSLNLRSHSISVAEDKSDFIRVNIQILDNLMNQISELVLIRNQVQQVDLAKITRNEFSNLSKRLNQLTSEMQHEIIQTRMQPIGKTLVRFTRMIRELSRTLDKKINFVIEGEETELDRSLTEAIVDPLTHILRNACDHGFERPSERLELNKEEEGTLKVKAYHHGGQVVVEISDDGRGLDPDKLKEKAVLQGLLSRHHSMNLPAKKALQLIFHPGFSTADQVSEISGRGVGMDVVRSSIEKFGGAVDLSSELGEGTTVTLKVPLTLAIMPILLVQVCGQNFAVPQIKLEELLKLRYRRNGVRGGIEDLNGQQVYRLRGEILPLIDLREALGFDSKPRGDGVWDFENVVVINSDQGEYGLIVDEIGNSIDVVVKPLANCLKKVRCYAGASVLGDGAVALILDVNGLGENSRLSAEEPQVGDVGGLQETEWQDDQQFLVVDIGLAMPYLIPLDAVFRLEEIRVAELQSTEKFPFVSYRDGILPIIAVKPTLCLGQDEPSTDVLDVVVVEYQGLSLGLQVKSIKDVIHSKEPIDPSIRDRRGILGNVAVDQKVFTVLDVVDLLQVSGVWNYFFGEDPSAKLHQDTLVNDKTAT